MCWWIIDHFPYFLKNIFKGTIADKKNQNIKFISVIMHTDTKKKKKSWNHIWNTSSNKMGKIVLHHCHPEKHPPYTPHTPSGSKNVSPTLLHLDRSPKQKSHSQLSSAESCWGVGGWTAVTIVRISRTVLSRSQVAIRCTRDTCCRRRNSAHYPSLILRPCIEHTPHQW